MLFLFKYSSYTVCFLWENNVGKGPTVLEFDKIPHGIFSNINRSTNFDSYSHMMLDYSSSAFK